MLYGIILNFFLFLLFGSESGNAKEQHNSSCCRRIPHSYIIGHAISGHPIQLDVGRCSATCGETETYESDNYVSVLERLRRQKIESTVTKCQAENNRGRATCEPSLVHVETVAFNRGPKFFDVIDQCVCRKLKRRCERVSKLKRFFVGTKYESTVDIGECSGRCGKETNGKTCRPTRTNPHPITGPNGMISIQTIAECRCEPTCYRQQFNVAVTEKSTNENGEHHIKTKVVDVGRCVGTCGPIERCVVRSKKRGEPKCLMSLETNDVSCAPVRVNDVTYTNRNGEKKRVAQIRRCGCS